MQLTELQLTELAPVSTWTDSACGRCARVIIVRTPTSDHKRRRAVALADALVDEWSRSGLSQRRLAKAAGVSEAWIRKVRRGQILAPGFFETAAIADHLGLDLNGLAGQPPILRRAVKQRVRRKERFHAEQLELLD